MLLQAKEPLRKMLSAATGYYGGLVQSYSLSGTVPTLTFQIIYFSIETNYNSTPLYILFDSIWS
jgi:hypothetical protein